MSKRYLHDCNNCIFLGTYQKYDLYFCKTPQDLTVIARYGDEGSFYLSRSIFDGPIKSEILGEAMRLSLIKYKNKEV